MMLITLLDMKNAKRSMRRQSLDRRLNRVWGILPADATVAMAENPYLHALDVMGML